MADYLKRLDDFDGFHDFALSPSYPKPNVTALGPKEVYYNNIATDRSNPELMDIARGAGWVASGATALTYADAFSVTTEQFNAANVIVADSNAPNGYDVTFKNLVHFEEFEYFLGVSAICKTDETSSSHGGFYNATKLETIKLPSSLVEIGDYAFNSCSSLKAITLPSSVKSLGIRSFTGDQALRSVELNEGLEILGQQCFLWGTGDINLVIPSTVKAFKRMCLYRETGTFPEDLILPDFEELGEEMLANQWAPRRLIVGDKFWLIGGGSAYTGDYNDCFWESLESVSISASNPYLKSVDDLYVYSKDGKIFYGGADYGLSKLQTIEIAEGCEKIMAGAMRSVKKDHGILPVRCTWMANSASVYTRVVLPSTITYIGDRAAQYMTDYDLEIRATTPPTRANYNFLYVNNIYVPAESVDTYTAASGWKSVKNKIKPIPTE